MRIDSGTQVGLRRSLKAMNPSTDSALDTSRDSQNLRFTQAFLDSDGTDLGIGFWLSGDEAWIALSFH